MFFYLYFKHWFVRQSAGGYSSLKGVQRIYVRTLRGALPIRDVRDPDHTEARDGFLQPHKVPQET